MPVSTRLKQQNKRNYTYSYKTTRIAELLDEVYQKGIYRIIRQKNKKPIVKKTHTQKIQDSNQTQCQQKQDGIISRNNNFDNQAQKIERILWRKKNYIYVNQSQIKPYHKYQKLNPKDRLEAQKLDLALLLEQSFIRDIEEEKGFYIDQIMNLLPLKDYDYRANKPARKIDNKTGCTMSLRLNLIKTICQIFGYQKIKRIKQKNQDNQQQKQQQKRYFMHKQRFFVRGLKIKQPTINYYNQ